MYELMDTSGSPVDYYDWRSIHSGSHSAVRVGRGTGRHSHPPYTCIYDIHMYMYMYLHTARPAPLHT